MLEEGSELSSTVTQLEQAIADLQGLYRGRRQSRARKQSDDYNALQSETMLYKLDQVLRVVSNRVEMLYVTGNFDAICRRHCTRSRSEATVDTCPTQAELWSGTSRMGLSTLI